MIKIICLENSKSLSKTLITELKSKEDFEVECFSHAIEGIIEIHKNPPNLLIISSLLKDLRGADALEYIKNDKYLASIPVIMYSTVTNTMNDIYFNKADSFIRRDENFAQKIINEVDKYSKIDGISTPESISKSETEILLDIDKIYQNRDIQNIFVKKLLENFLILETMDILIESFFTILFSSFTLSSLNINFGNKNYKKTFEKFNNYKNEYQKFKIEKDNISIFIEFLSESKEEEYNLKFALDVITKILHENYRYNYNVEKAQKLNYLFKNFLPEKVVDDLLNRKTTKSLMTGEKREVAVIFSHIKKFNELEETLSAEGVVNFLNKHFSGLSTRIKSYGGEINKFIGDAVFAMVGAPLSFNDNEERALNAAKEMIEFVESCPENYKIGIGIHIGKAIIGNIGSEDNFDYTAIGDTINLAARLESLCKYYNVNILVSNTVFEACKRKNSKTEFRIVDTVMVQGKKEATTIYSAEDLNFYPENFIHTYNKGIKMFSLGNWNFALDYFNICYSLLPSDRIVEIYINRCKKFLINPPESWDGAIILDFK
ncbi:MAG: adenylate/guanylate cyclase domain-containing response regulator [Spirochaetales bacterium]|nr:adenylate/guanylate cyclase domain-containing response regulator [Spirochaetales bacterium]